MLKLLNHDLAANLNLLLRLLKNFIAILHKHRANCQ